MKWQPIEIATKEGDTWILITDGKIVCPAYWGPSYFESDYDSITYSHRSECAYADTVDPTHWMPLPAPPEES